MMKTDSFHKTVIHHKRRDFVLWGIFISSQLRYICSRNTVRYSALCYYSNRLIKSQRIVIFCHHAVCVFLSQICNVVKVFFQLLFSDEVSSQNCETCWNGVRNLTRKITRPLHETDAAISFSKAKRCNTKNDPGNKIRNIVYYHHREHSSIITEYSITSAIFHKVVSKVSKFKNLDTSAITEFTRFCLNVKVLRYG